MQDHPTSLEAHSPETPHARGVDGVPRSGSCDEKAKRRHPFSRVIGRVLRGKLSPEQAAAKVVGPKRSAIWMREIRRARIRDATRDRLQHRDGASELDESAIRRIVALALIVCGELGLTSRRACSRTLYQGRTYRTEIDGDGVVNERAYFPSPGGTRCGGLGSRLGVSVRTVSRYAAVLHGAGIVHHWRVDESIFDRAPGSEHQCVSKLGNAYAMWWLPYEMPRELARRLTRWRNKPAARASSTRRITAEEAAAPVSDTDHEALLQAAAGPEPELGTLSWYTWIAGQNTGPPS